MNKEDILRESPVTTHVPTQWAYYGTECCWWTSFPEDVERRDGKDVCPHCGGLVMPIPLTSFLESAEFNAPRGVYGYGGLGAFYASHERNAHTCKQSFDHYLWEPDDGVE